MPPHDSHDRIGEISPSRQLLRLSTSHSTQRSCALRSYSPHSHALMLWISLASFHHTRPHSDRTPTRWESSPFYGVGLVFFAFALPVSGCLRSTIASCAVSPITDWPDSCGSFSYWWQGDSCSSDVVGGEGGRSAVWQECGGRLACYTHKKEVKAENCASRRLWLHVDAHMQQV
jgi:hypothetical protein